MPRPRLLNDAMVQRFRQRLKNGDSVPVIAQSFGVHPRTLYRCAKRLREGEQGGAPQAIGLAEHRPPCYAEANP